jgi:uncharacterized membrane protein
VRVRYRVQWSLVAGFWSDIERMTVETKQQADQPEVEQTNHLRATLLTSTEGRILLLGVAITFLYSLWLGAKVVFSPSQGQALVGVTATMAIFGQAAGLACGYALDLWHPTVIFVCMIVETVSVLIFYPLFVFSWRHLLVIKRLKNSFERIHKAAEANQAKIQRYGIIGLFIFVWFPFWMTGAMVGSVIGFLLGMPTWLNMTVVLVGAYAAIFSWAFFMHHFHRWAAAFNTYAPMVLVAVLILVVIAGHFLQRTLHDRKNRIQEKQQ